MTRTRRKASVNTDAVHEPLEENSLNTNSSMENFSKLDLFALLASSAIAKKMDDPVHIAQASFAVAKEMMRLSEIYAEKATNY